METSWGDLCVRVTGDFQSGKLFWKLAFNPRAFSPGWLHSKFMEMSPPQGGESALENRGSHTASVKLSFLSGEPTIAWGPPPSLQLHSQGPLALSSSPAYPNAPYKHHNQKGLWRTVLKNINCGFQEQPLVTHRIPHSDSLTWKNSIRGTETQPCP